MPKEKKHVAEDQRAMETVTGELGALLGMTIVQLKEKYQQVFGQPCHSRNKDYLRKRIAYRIQENAFGGLSKQARDRLDQLIADSPNVRQRRSKRSEAASTAEARPTQVEPAAQSTLTAERDPRLPAAGTVLKREHNGQEHSVKVLEVGFEYQGHNYRSLSAVARAITGTQWNGMLFWGLASRNQTKGAQS
jgi:hypothetical protein